MINKETKRLDIYGEPIIYPNFIWNKRKHFPMITLDYLVSEYSIDYENEMNLTNAEALRDIREVFDISYDLVMKSKASESKRAFLYNVAKDEDILYKILELQVVILRAYMMTGSISDIYDSEDFKLPEVVLNYLRSSGLNHPYWYINTYDLDKSEGVDY